MEVGFIDKKENKEYEDFFQLEYKNQNVKILPEFQKWYKRVDKLLYEENKKRVMDLFNIRKIKKGILLISFCNKCCSYVICSYYSRHSKIKCTKCGSNFCAGCLKEIIEEDETTCLKAYLKLLYLRIRYERSDVYDIPRSYKYIIYICHIIFCIFFTPSYIGYLSFDIGLKVHRYKKKLRGLIYLI